MPPDSAILSPADYSALGEFRYRIRCFLQFSESATRAEGMEPQQHQLLLAVRALEHADGPTIGALADHLLIRHHSAVGLIDRMAERGLVERVPGTQDRRQVKVKLTAQGETKLRRLSEIHREELRHSGPTLVAALSSILGHLHIQEQDVIPRRET
jgi:DNA-binding MarR family transcriptional regulator